VRIKKPKLKRPISYRRFRYYRGQDGKIKCGYFSDAQFEIIPEKYKKEWY